MSAPPTSDQPRAKVSLSLNAKSTSSSAANGTAAPGKRRRTAFSDDQEDEPQDTSEQITSFSVEEATKPAPARMIEPLEDTRTWGSRAGRQKSTLPRVQQPDSPDTPIPQPEDEPRYGLQFPSRRQAAAEQPAPTNPSHFPAPAPTEDDEALARLTGETAGPQTTIVSEDAAFDRDVAAASLNPSLEDYQSVPIEGFGAALMRGYLPQGETIESWKSTAAAKTRREGGSRRVDADGNIIVARRAELLGLGAKELDLGAAADKGKKKGGKGKPPMDYQPLARRNVATGAVISEQEYRKHVEGGGADAAERERADGEATRRREENGERALERRREGREGDRKRSEGDRRRGDRSRERDHRDRTRDRERDRDHDRDRRRDDYGRRERDRDGRRERDYDDRARERRRGERDERDERGSRRHHRDERERERHGDASIERRRERR